MYHITQGLCFTEVSSLILNQSLFIVGCSGGTNYLLKFNKNPPKNVFSTTEFKNVIFRTTSVFCLSIYWWVLNLYAAIQLKLLNQFEKSASSYCQFMDRFMFKVFFFFVKIKIIKSITNIQLPHMSKTFDIYRFIRSFSSLGWNLLDDPRSGLLNFI